MFAKVLAVVATSALVLSITNIASADETAESAPPARPEQPKTETRWYGYQTLAADGSALAFVALSGAVSNDGAKTGFGLAALGSYAIAPAIIHAVNGHPWRGVGDAAIRLAAPVAAGFLGAMIGAAAYKPSNDPNAGLSDAFGMMGAEMVGLEIGVLTGIAAAVTIDAAVLAKDEVPAAAPKTASITPLAGPTKNGFTAGVGGTF
jgi:hypothetical protein